MIEEKATVVGIEEEFAWIETRRTSACAACTASKGCGTGVLSRVLGKRLARVKALNQIDAHVGDEVIVGISENALVRGSLAIYIVPLIWMFVFGLAGELGANRLGIEHKELATVVAGLLGIYFGFMWVRKFSMRISTSSEYQPVILRKTSGMVVG